MGSMASYWVLPAWSCGGGWAERESNGRWAFPSPGLIVGQEEDGSL